MEINFEINNIFYLVSILILLGCVGYIGCKYIKKYQEEQYEIELKKVPSFPIDVVYTWAGESDSLDKRLSNNNELKYSLRSVIKFAPWINRIYILMNPPVKTPSWFNEKYSEKITLLDQTDTFPSGYTLPCLNSNAIETTLQNIPGLSEHFMYFNDDVFLGKPVAYTDFFTEDGKAVVSDTIFNLRDMLIGEDVLGIKYPKMVKKFYPHVPINLRKSYILDYHNEYPDYINWVRGQRFRKGIGCKTCKKHNLLCPCAQQHHIIARFMYDNGGAVTKDYGDLSTKSCMTKLYVNSKCIHILDKILEDPPKHFCINDTTSSKRQKKYIRNKMKKFFEEFYPDVPFFESQQ